MSPISSTEFVIFGCLPHDAYATIYNVEKGSAFKVSAKENEQSRKRREESKKPYTNLEIMR